MCCGAPTDSYPTMAANSFGLGTGDGRRRFEPMPGVFSIVGGATARGCGGGTRGDEVSEAAAEDGRQRQWTVGDEVRAAALEPYLGSGARWRRVHGSGAKRQGGSGTRRSGGARRRRRRRPPVSLASRGERVSSPRRRGRFRKRIDGAGVFLQNGHVSSLSRTIKIR
jgi:hypothetical protein